MNARRDRDTEPEAGSSGGRVLLAGAVVFALAATAALVLADELRWMRLGIVAALWAALVGAFLAAKYRRQVRDQEQAAAERQELYELELEREVAARREYELEVAADARRQADEDARDDIAALRDELHSLRSTLEGLLGGEFLVERYALRAESTRMRSLSDDRQLKGLPAASGRDDVPAVVREAETELIERISEVQEPRREPEQRPSSLPRRADRPGGRTDWPKPAPSGPVKRVEPVRREPPRAEAQPHPAEVSDRWFVPGALVEGDSSPGNNQWEPDEFADFDDDEWTPSWESAGPPRRAEPPAPNRWPTAAEPPTRYTADPGGGRRSAPDEPTRYAAPPHVADTGGGRRAEPPTRFAAAADVADAGPARRSPPMESGRFAAPPPDVADAGGGWRARQDVEPPAAAAGHAPVRDQSRPPHDTGAPVGHRAEQTSWLAQYNQPEVTESQSYPPRPDPAEPDDHPIRTDRLHRHGRAEPADSGRYAVPAVDDAPAGRRHARPDAEPETGGRRRRAEGQPTWQETVALQVPRNGSHAHPEPAPREEPTGSHAAGRSVTELLATHGVDASPRRRRRRED